MNYVYEMPQEMLDMLEGYFTSKKPTSKEILTYINNEFGWPKVLPKNFKIDKHINQDEFLKAMQTLREPKLDFSFIKKEKAREDLTEDAPLEEFNEEGSVVEKFGESGTIGNSGKSTLKIKAFIDKIMGNANKLEAKNEQPNSSQTENEINQIESENSQSEAENPSA